MASFEVKVRTLEVQPHPNADAIEIAQVFGYQSIIKKDQFKTGDLCIYIPEQSIVPEKLLEFIGLTGKLAGSNKNRVKAIKLRGVLSQGICIGFDGLKELYSEKEMPLIEDGSDFQEFLEIEKWSPIIPARFSGVWVNPIGDDLNYFKTYTDIENIKRYPNIIQEGEEIFATEKLHGSCFINSIINNNFYVSSKGITKNGHALEQSDSNVYWKTSIKYDIENKLRKLIQNIKDINLLYNPNSDTSINEITLFGEVLGVQDLLYGFKSSDTGFRAFDIRVNGVYVDYNIFKSLCESIEIEMVPLVYIGNSISEALKFTNGNTLIGNIQQIREGVVIKPTMERYSNEIGRVVLKSVSENYLTRKGDATEFE